MICLGTMSGTSFDGVDVAIIETDGKSCIKLLGGRATQYDPAFSQKLKEITTTSNYFSILEVEKEITKYHANAINSLLSLVNLKASDVDCIGFHGQTIFHNVERSLTLQLSNPHLLAELTGINVISDFRRRDMAAGGCGAPLVPIFHKALAQLLNLEKVIFLNIGGVSNITYINNNEILAFDTGPGNAIIDDFIYLRTGSSFDNEGAIANSGRADLNIINELLKDDFFKNPPPKALDRDHFKNLLQSVQHLNLNDGAATISYFTAAAIKESLKFIGPAENIVACGGGRKNSFLMHTIEKICGVKTININNLGIDGDLVEAYAFGYLAARSTLKLPISYTSTTGVQSDKIGGSITYA